MAYVIRAFREDDADALGTLTTAAIRKVGSRHYTTQQVEAWASRHENALRLRDRAAAGVTIIVAADAEDIPVAYALIEPPLNAAMHLDMLYCHPDHTKKGLADELLAQAEAEARAQGALRLFTEASELARPAFERAGYEVEHRRDFEIEGPDGSVPIHNYAMQKSLD